jgi:hypothetical protein
MDEKEQEIKQTWDVTSGKGRKDEVGHTGIYPASTVDQAPADAEVMGQEELGHRSPKEEIARAEDVELAEPRPASREKNESV